MAVYATENVDETNTETTQAGGWIADPYERLTPSINENLLGLADKYDPRDEGFFTDCLLYTSPSPRD